MYAIFLDRNTLTSQQRLDLRDAISAVSSFWAAVELDPCFSLPTQSPLERCILSALTVRDTLHAVGRRDAITLRSGLDLRMTTGYPRHSLTIGTPSTPKLEKKWNAHLVVRLGDILVDAVYGQTKRHWNNSPRGAVFLITTPEITEIDVEPGTNANVTTSHRYPFRTGHIQTTYFRLPYSVDFRTRKWRTVPDARLERRSDLVERAAGIYLAQRSAAEEEGIAMPPSRVEAVGERFSCTESEDRCGSPEARVRHGRTKLLPYLRRNIG